MKRHFGLRLVALTILLAGVEQARATGNLVQNPGFESGTFAPDWFGSTGVTVASGSAHSGTYDALFGQGNGISLFQQLMTGPGTYDISFWLLDSGWAGSGSGANASDEFKVVLNNTTALDLTKTDLSGPDPNQNGYALYTAVVSTSANNPLLEFEATSSVDFFRLDDVSVTPDVSAPEPSSLVLLAPTLFAVLGYFGYQRRKLAVA